MALIIKNGKLVKANETLSVDIKVEGEKITDIGKLTPSSNDYVIDAAGKYVLPGGIETHTHLDLESMGTVTADDFYSGTKAAVLGGTTTVIDFATQFHGETMQQGLDRWMKKALDKSFIDFSFHMACTEWNENLLNEMESIVNQGISSFKLYMAYKNNMMVRDDEIYQAINKSKKLGATIGFHCENGDIIDELVKKYVSEGKISPYYHHLTHPPELEIEAIDRLLTIAELTNAPVYVVHLSTIDGLKIIENMREKGVKVAAETCPQYLVLNKSKYGEKDDTSFEAAKYLCSPPLREKRDADGLWEGLANKKIQFVGTDHCSFNYLGQKDMGIDDFRKIPNGIPGIQLRMLLLYSYGVASKKFSINRFSEITATNAAKYFGMYPKKGTLEIGSDADIIILDPNSKSVVSVEELSENVDYTPYEGLEIEGCIEFVILRGKVVVEKGKLTDTAPSGEFIKCNSVDINIS